MKLLSCALAALAVPGQPARITATQMLPQQAVPGRTVAGAPD